MSGGPHAQSSPEGAQVVDPLNEGPVKTAAGKLPMDVSEGKETLLAITLGPMIWVIHFSASYLTNAIYCAKFADESGDASFVQNAIYLYTAIALPLVGAVAWYSYRRHRYDDSPPPHDGDSREDRFRFLGYASFLLSILSAIAILFTALVAVFIGTCH
jgi:hypothetical protein